ncbi:MAG: phosphoribosylglycinamide formyltransferase [Pseudomonadota bacterium]
MRPRIAILISGRGSNMGALLAARASIPADFALVLSDQATATGLATAREEGLSVSVVEREKGQSKAAHEAAMIEALKEAGVTHIALAGFMRLLSDEFLAQFEAVVNIHPSLLPAFKGLETHTRALSARAKVHGCTVHQVDADMDTGPIIAQAGLSVRAGESAEDLGARVLRLEHALYPVALTNFLTGQA